jgi:hypothetical protein
MDMAHHMRGCSEAFPAPPPLLLLLAAATDGIDGDLAVLGSAADLDAMEGLAPLASPA